MIAQFNLTDFLGLLGKVHYDEAFDRRYGAWDVDKQRHFITNLINKKVDSLPVWADIDQCLRYADKTGDTEGGDVLRGLKARGLDYVSIDGKHRAFTIWRFMENQLAITAKVEDCDGIIHKIENRFLCDMPQAARSAIVGSLVSVTIVTNEKYSGFGSRYRCLNDGEPQNNQEVRTSYSTPVAPWIRAQREKHKDALSRVVKNTDAIRMLDDELLAKITMATIRGYGKSARTNSRLRVDPNLGSGDIDAWYKAGIGVRGIESVGSPYNRQQFDRTEQILEMMCLLFKEQDYYPPSKLIAKKAIWVTLFGVEYIKDNDYSIVDPAELFRLIKQIDDGLITESGLKYAKACEEAIKKGEDPDEIKKHVYYCGTVNLPHQSSARKRRQEIFKDRFMNYIQNNGPLAAGLREMKRQAA